MDPVLTFVHHTCPQHGVMIWGAISFDSKTSVVVIPGTLIEQCYVDDILQPILKEQDVNVTKKENTKEACEDVEKQIEFCHSKHNNCWDIKEKIIRMGQHKLLYSVEGKLLLLASVPS
ncbi:hypothetical protein LAZ67_1007919 [Cordylochernes scorpioides]|uniref:Uncharacterized protein n=1 Tax=Cordylochernes scorpioides TaxID=51811 RepID=A0ABY6JZL9_9ARAC|nr:hypothetical protein LAZ67_1007919 [Cordylochernes scorpioides]